MTMIQTNKLTEKHLDHEYTTRRAEPNSPHWGYYWCITCDKFITWINRDIYNQESTRQRSEETMWFGKYQGTPLTEVPEDYLKWAVANITNKNIDKIRAEQERRIASREAARLRKQRQRAKL